MNSITAAIIAGLVTEAVSNPTETSKTSITDAYQALKGLLVKKFGATSDVVQAIDHLESKPTSISRQGGLQEEIVAVKAEQDSEVLAAAKHLLTLAQPQQAALGKFTIQNNVPMQRQMISDYNAINQHFGNPPTAPGQNKG